MTFTPVNAFNAVSFDPAQVAQAFLNNYQPFQPVELASASINSGAPAAPVLPPPPASTTPGINPGDSVVEPNPAPAPVPTNPTGGFSTSGLLTPEEDQWLSTLDPKKREDFLTAILQGNILDRTKERATAKQMDLLGTLLEKGIALERERREAKYLQDQLSAIQGAPQRTTEAVLKAIGSRAPIQYPLVQHPLSINSNQLYRNLPTRLGA